MTMHTPTHERSADYFSHARTEIESLLPKGAVRVLDVGCGKGATVEWLKEDGRCSFAAGIEMDGAAAQRARRHCDRVAVGDAQEVLDQALAWGPYDVVLCLDVLEHMIEPWEFLGRLAAGLAPGAHVIASVPNVRHYKVSLPLLLAGRFEYEAQGVLDRTHLRFFTRRSARRMFDGGAFELAALRPSRPPAGSPSWFAHVASFGLLSDLFAVQFLLDARRV